LAVVRDTNWPKT